eukprot:jgi/Mesvir1/14933/Mv05522-RA.2
MYVPVSVRKRKLGESQGNRAQAKLPSPGTGSNIQGDSRAAAERPSSSSEPEIIVRSLQQRPARPGEVTCVICKRYAEYVCDATDEDVCSLECKAAVLERAGLPVPAHVTSALTSSIPNIEDHRDPGKPSRQSEEHANQMRAELNIRVKTTGCQLASAPSHPSAAVPAPVADFRDFGFLEKLLANVADAGYSRPTPIQMQAIPVILAGRDVMACAPTSSGKTAAFLLPLLHKLCHLAPSQRAWSHPSRGGCDVHAPEPHPEAGQGSEAWPETRPPGTGGTPGPGKLLGGGGREVSSISGAPDESPAKPRALVLAPTRELCIQIEETAKRLAAGLPVRTALVIGGQPLPRQLYRLKQGGAQLVIATPGRLIDLLAQHDAEVDLSELRMLVVDEVDAMLRMGFWQQDASSIDGPSGSLEELVLWVDERQKKDKLFQILTDRRHYHPPVLVFVASKIGAEMLASSVTKKCGVACAAIHGDLSMRDRAAILEGLTSGRLPVVISTGLLARGMDLPSVMQVVVFDMPATMEDVIHQIGRAGRGGNKGHAILFVNNENRGIFNSLMGHLRKKRETQPGLVIPPQLERSPYATADP